MFEFGSLLQKSSVEIQTTWTLKVTCNGAAGFFVGRCRGVLVSIQCAQPHNRRGGGRGGCAKRLPFGGWDRRGGAEAVWRMVLL